MPDIVAYDEAVSWFVAVVFFRLMHFYPQKLTRHFVVQAASRQRNSECTLFYLDPPYYETEGYGVAFPFGEYLRRCQSNLSSVQACRRHCCGGTALAG